MTKGTQGPSGRGLVARGYNLALAHRTAHHEAGKAIVVALAERAQRQAELEAEVGGESLPDGEAAVEDAGGNGVQAVPAGTGQR